jgi:sugar/nucleoside kinase (ribokinase family)
MRLFGAEDRVMGHPLRTRGVRFGLAAALLALDGCEVSLVTAIGRDEAGVELAALMDEAGVELVPLAELRAAARAG